MCDNIDNENTVDKHATRRARKPHVCCACHETIRRGDRYEHSSQLAEGRWSTYRHCLRCFSMIRALWATGAEWVQWDLDCGEVMEDPPDDVAALAFMTRDEAQETKDLEP